MICPSCNQERHIPRNASKCLICAHNEALSDPSYVAATQPKRRSYRTSLAQRKAMAEYRASQPKPVKAEEAIEISGKKFDKVTCSKCHSIKHRSTDHYGKGRSRYYNDENGRRWEGRSCPDCVIKRNDERNEKVRQSKS